MCDFTCLEYAIASILGTVNGINRTFGSLSRAVGPMIAGQLYAYGLGISRPALVWRVWFSLFAFGVWIGTWFMVEENRLTKVLTG